MSFHIIFVTFQQLVDNLPHPPWILHKPDHNRELLWTFELFLRGSSVKVVAMIIYKSGALHCTLAPIAETSLGLFHTEGNRDWKRRSKSKASQKSSFSIGVNGPLDSRLFHSEVTSNQHFTIHLCLPYSVFFWRTEDFLMTSTTVDEEYDGPFLLHIRLYACLQTCYRQNR